MNKIVLKKMKKKIIVSGIAGFFLILLYTAIFSFSSQDGEQSGNLSQMISKKCVEIINSLSGKSWTEARMQDIAEYFEHPIRKLAHFSEYAVMGILVYLLWKQWISKMYRLYLLIIIWVFLSAAADEIHQLFVPDRYGSVWDVLLDTCGGVFGLICCILGTKWIKRNTKVSSNIL